MGGVVYTFNEAPDTGECRHPAHHGWEVIAWPTDEVVGPDEVDVYAVCRDEETARLLANTLNAQQIPGQTAIEVSP